MTTARDKTAPVLLECADRVATITLNRPERKNALNLDALEGLRDAINAVKRNDAVRAVIITGSGGDFCSGADLGSNKMQCHPLNFMRWIGDIAHAVANLEKPLVAKVEGAAVGAGWNLALCADLVVASSSARFCQIFGRRGMSVDFGGSWTLPRYVGLQQAKRLVMLGEFIDAEEALRLGLVTWVCRPEEIDQFVADLADKLAAGPPVALAQSKALLNDAHSRTLREALECEAAAQIINFATDAPEAKRAFMDKTNPEFKGRWQL